MAAIRPQRTERGTGLLDRSMARGLALAAVAAAERFARGGTLWCVEAGRGAHARHVAVEFVHPVLVGKPALPAASVIGPAPASALEPLIGDADIVIALGPSSGPVEAALRVARRRGTLTIWTGCGPRASLATADHLLWLDDDATAAGHAAAGAHDGHLVLLYHLLWELTHLCLELGAASSSGGSGAQSTDGAADFLYPFLAHERPDPVDLTDDLADAAMVKAQESAALRARSLEALAPTLDRAAAAMARRFDDGGRLLACGNGGSSTDAEVVVQLFCDPAQAAPIPAISLVDDSAVVTALANDVGYDLVFARQLIALARPADIVVGVSTSGDSRNLLAAFSEGRRRGLLTIGLAGGGGGAMASSPDIDHLLLVDSDRVHRIQETQATVLYELWRRVVVERGGRV